MTSSKVPRYWIAVASRDHVKKGLEFGFGQACHGKCGPLSKTKPGDWIVYYSPKLKISDKVSTCKKFTAIGIVKSSEPYKVEMSKDHHPFRIDVDFKSDFQEVNWDAVKDKITFAPKLRFGFGEMTQQDFELLQELM